MGEKIVIDSWREFSDQLEKWENEPLMFRGVTSAKHQLIPKIGRAEARVKNANDYSQQYEERIFKEFIRRARPYQDAILRPEIDWLVLAQHHGLPTRLLDWTLSPLIAAYFAVSKMGSHFRHKDDSTEDNYTALYAAPIPPAPYDDPNQYKIFPDRLYPNYDGLIEPPHISPRITAQMALMTIHQNPTAIYDVPNIEKVLFTTEFSPILKRMLINFGISRSILFPGLDGIAADLEWEYKWGDFHWEKK